MAPRRLSRASRAVRTRAPVSYTENSSENEDLSDGSDTPSEEETSGAEGDNKAPTTRSRSSRRTRAYASTPPEFKSHTALYETSSRKTESSELRKALTNAKHSPITRSSSKRKHASSNLGSLFKKRKQSTSKYGKSSGKASYLKDSGVVPPWQTLPYHILLDIFEYASRPLYDYETFQPSPSGRWLLAVSQMCRSFAEPALTSLYVSPPLVPMEKAHNLVDLLKRDPGTTMYKYRQKVKYLRIDIGQVAQYKLAKRGYLDLSAMLRLLPRLEDLEFYHQKDRAPYRELGEMIKWTYPSSLLSSLEWYNPEAAPENGEKTTVTCLRSWRWSSRLSQNWTMFPTIKSVHTTPMFSGLRKVAFINYRDDVEDQITQSLTCLPHLEHLILESSPIVNGSFLTRLPKSLKQIELTNCNYFTSDDFQAFILAYGSNLRIITLNHNKSLSLFWLQSLGSACPILEALKMDLTYFTESSFIIAPSTYVDLTSHVDTPTWPSTLRVLSLTQLKHHDTDSAEAFFNSLLKSADNLRDLRTLTLHVILHISWRARAAFRDRWIDALNSTFKRIAEDPKPHCTLSEVPIEHKLSLRNRCSTSSDGSNSRTGSSSGKELKRGLGLCEVVNVRIDDERTRETTATEADFLDSEPEGDSDYEK